MDEFIDAVITAMRRHKMTVDALAEATGIHRSHMYKILNGNTIPSFERAELIANHLGLKISVGPLDSVSQISYNPSLPSRDPVAS